MKIEDVKNKFQEIGYLFRCPLCKEDLRLENNSFVCNTGHCFDLSKRGYLNFIPNQGKTHYSKNLFQSRREVFLAGFYKEVTEQVIELVREAVQSEPKVCLDAGCGEGYFTHILQKAFPLSKTVGVDLEKQAVSMGKFWSGKEHYVVGDLANIPLRDNSVDCLFNILSPANYKEFHRVLSEEGLLVKVVPAEGYLQELRFLAREELQKEAYSNKEVVTLFEKNFSNIKRRRITYKKGLDKESLHWFLQMTPMMFHIDTKEIIKGAIKEITIDLELLVGRKKDT